MADPKEKINADKFGWQEGDLRKLPDDGRPADPFAEVQDMIAKVDKQLTEAEAVEDEDE